MTREAIEMQRHVMLNMDAPHHTRCARSSPADSPRGRWAPAGRAEPARADIAKAAAAEGSGDFVEQVACELPLQAIADLLGVPQEDRDKLFDWSNEMMGGEDPEFAQSIRRWPRPS